MHHQAALAGALCCACSVHADVLYTLVDLGPAFQVMTSGGPGINNAGHMALGTPAGPAVWVNGVTTPLPQGIGGWGNEINEIGNVAGRTTAAPAAAWLGGSFVNLGPSLPGQPMMGRSINNSNQVVAWSRVGGSDRTFVYHNGTVTDIGTFGLFCYGEDINDQGQVVGYSRPIGGGARAFIWSGGALMDIPVAPGSDTFAYGVNNSGTVVGDVNLLTPYKYENGVPILMSPFPATDLNRPLAINDEGLIVGFSRLTAGGFRAMLWEGTQVFSLNTLAGNPAGWVLEVASDINDSGQITGTGMFNGQPRTFLLNPIPGPGAPALLCATAPLLLTRPRRRTPTRG